MRFTHILPLASLGLAYVVPDEQVLASLPPPESYRPSTLRDGVNGFLNKLRGPHPSLDAAASTLRNTIDHALESVGEVVDAGARKFTPGFDAEAWLENGSLDIDGDRSLVEEDPEHPPHHEEPPHHGPPHRRPPHGKPPHHHKTNKTIYELIAGSKYTTKLAKLVSEYPDIVEALNSTKANFTVFAPTDYAFSKIPEHAPKPSKEFLEKVLLYHVSPGLYPAGRLLFSHTVPTLLNATLLGDKPQRLVAKVGLKGVAINFYSRVVAVNIPATNGLIHGVDSILIPPPKTLKILSLLPSEYSTLLLGLSKTGLTEALASAKNSGGTFFAPGNFAFKKLGPAINAFLFSQRGEKYLKALLTYHVVANETLYSTAYYGPAEPDVAGPGDAESKSQTYHYDLPTLLEDKSLSVDQARYGPFVSFKINGFVRVTVADGVARDGVVHAVSDVLIPPKTRAGVAEFWQGAELSVSDLVQRLEPYLDEDAGGWEL